MPSKKKYNFNLDPELVSRIDAEAALRHINRTQYIIRACEQMLSADEYMRNAPEIQETMNKLISLFPSV